MEKVNKKKQCTLSDKELIVKSNYWVSKLAKSGGKDWCLRVSVDFNHDPDMLFGELGKRLKSRNEEVAQLAEALQQAIDLFNQHEDGYMYLNIHDWISKTK